MNNALPTHFYNTNAVFFCSSALWDLAFYIMSNRVWHSQLVDRSVCTKQDKYSIMSWPIFVSQCLWKFPVDQEYWRLCCSHSKVSFISNWLVGSPGHLTFLAWQHPESTVVNRWCHRPPYLFSGGHFSWTGSLFQSSFKPWVLSGHNVNVAVLKWVMSVVLQM